MRNLSGRLSAIQVVVYACSCVAFLLDVIVNVAAACREISLSDHTDQGIVAGVSLSVIISRSRVFTLAVRAILFSLTLA